MTGRSTVDWEAVERDYRTTNLTLRELAQKHGIGHSAIGNRVTRHEWKRDLTDAVKAATRARVIEEAVTDLVSKTGQGVTKSVTDTVLAAAEVNTQLILKHKKRLSDLHDLVLLAKQKVEEVTGAVSGVRDASVLVGAVSNLATATKALNAGEREAFGLDDKGAPERSYEDTLRDLNALIEQHGSQGA